MRVTITVDGVPLFDSGDRDPKPDAIKAIATVYAGLNDDDQARFFEYVGQIMEAWPNSRGLFQADFIGGHMGSCTCITETGRRFLRHVYETMAVPASPSEGA